MKTMNMKKWLTMLTALVLLLSCAVALAGEGQYIAEAPAVTISPVEVTMSSVQVPLAGPEGEGEKEVIPEVVTEVAGSVTDEVVEETVPTAEPTVEPPVVPTAELTAEPTPEVRPSVVAFANMPRVLAEGDNFKLESIVENTNGKEVSFRWQYNDGTDANEDGIADWYNIGSGADSLVVETTAQNLKTNWRLVCTIDGEEFVVNAVIKAHHKVTFHAEDGTQIGKTLFVETYTNMAKRAPAAPELEGRDFLGWEADGTALSEIRAAAKFTAMYSIIVEETEPEETPEAPPAEPTEVPEEIEPKVVLSYTAPDIITKNDVIVLTATLFGFDGKEVALQWQYTNEAGEWVDAPGKDQGLTYRFHPTIETIDAHWRIVVTIVE